MSRDLNETTPRMRDFALKLIGLAKEELGIRVIVTNVARRYEEQVALYAQGREILENVNKLRTRAGMGPITHKENIKVTWTLASKHIINLSNDNITDDLSHAIDFGILDKNGKYQGDIKADVNNDNKQDYIQLGALAKRIDSVIEWGGDWKKTKDYPHYQEPEYINPA